MSTDLQALAAAFLRGTARSAVPTPGEGALGQALSRVQGAAPEQILLARAALSGLYLQAGQVPTPAQMPAPVYDDRGPDPRRPVPPALLALLPTFAETPELLHQTLALLVAAGYTLPAPGALPLLALTDGGTDGLSGPLWTLLDDHGRWLAALNPDWKRHDPATPPDSLRQTRLRREVVEAHAASPAACVQDLIARWSTFKAEERRTVLNAVAASPHPADVPLLELALQDRLPDVRKQARLLQGHLPGEVQDAVRAALPTWFRHERGKLKVVPGNYVAALGQPEANTTTNTNITATADSELGRLLGAYPTTELPALLNLSLTDIISALKKYPEHTGTPANEYWGQRVLEELERASSGGLGLEDLETLRQATSCDSPAYWPRARLEERLWEASEKLLRVRQDSHALGFLVQSLMSALPSLPDRVDPLQTAAPAAPKGLLARLASALNHPPATVRDWPRRWEELALWIQAELGRDIQRYYSSPLADLLERLALALDVSRPDPLGPEAAPPTDLQAAPSKKQQEEHDRATALYNQQSRARAALITTLGARRRVQAALQDGNV